MKRIRAFYNKNTINKIIVTFLLSVLVLLYIETFARHSLIGALRFMVTSPLVYFFNTCIIFTTASGALVIKRRMFWYVFISFMWMLLGTVNGIILLNRMTPFTVADFSVLGDGLSLVTNYMSKTKIILIIAAVAAVILLFIYLFLKGPRAAKREFKKHIGILICIFAGMACISAGALKAGVVDTYFMNLAYGYRDYGVPYCFISSWVNKGISKPDNYTRGYITGRFDKGELGGRSTYSPEKKKTVDGSNIIFVQLESFMDPETIKGYSFSQDPIPNFRKMKKKYSSGIFRVPVVGAGTANTEFEAITGISAKFFGPGEYPYKEVLQEEPCESMAYDLKDIGYSSHAIHNHRGAFYGRNVAFKNLGFDTFTSLEYMNNAVTTPKNWAKDSILTGEIMAALNSTDGKDYIYTISVQGHGKYPEQQTLTNPVIKVTKSPSDTLRWQYGYYVNQLYEMDKFVKNLTDTLEKRNEDTVVIFYGDHIPALDITEENLKKGHTIFDTEYIIWSNFELEKQDKMLYAYQIGAEVQKRLGFKEGLITIYHQDHRKDKGYLKNLEALSYDMLYGKKYIYGEKMPFKATKLKMGVKDIKIKGIVKIGDKYYIKGQNFTEFSKVSLDGEVLSTTYLGPTILELNETVDRDAVDRMKVSQVEKNKEILSTTE